MKNNILVLTPAFSGGSWVCIERIISNLTVESKILILGLGKIFHRNKDFRYVSVPFLRYDKWGKITVLSPVIGLLWNFPLFISSIYFVIFYKPKVVIANGFTAGISIAPIVKLLNMKMIVMYHGYINNPNKFVENIYQKIFGLIDIVVVNSKGSFINLSHFFQTEKIVVNEHFADDIFFERPITMNIDKKLKIFYVGRLDEDKFCRSLIELAEYLKNNNNFNFTFAGVGQFDGRIGKLALNSSNINYLGYLSDRKKLRNYLINSDVVWSYADETYLALPAIEALASGTPIIIPKFPAIEQKIKDGVEIDHSLVPKEIGWVIDPHDSKKIIKLVMFIQSVGISKKKRNDCRNYAKVRYSKNNLIKTIKSINILLEEK